MKNEINKDEVRNLKMIMSSKDRKILNQEKKIESMLVTINVAYQMTECEKTRNVLQKLIK